MSLTTFLDSRRWVLTPAKSVVNKTLGPAGDDRRRVMRGILMQRSLFRALLIFGILRRVQRRLLVASITDKNMFAMGAAVFFGANLCGGWVPPPCRLTRR